MVRRLDLNKLLNLDATLCNFHTSPCEIPHNKKNTEKLEDSPALNTRSRTIAISNLSLSNHWVPKPIMKHKISPPFNMDLAKDSQIKSIIKAINTCSHNEKNNNNEQIISEI